MNFSKYVTSWSDLRRDLIQGNVARLLKHCQKTRGSDLLRKHGEFAFYILDPVKHIFLVHQGAILDVCLALGLVFSEEKWEASKEIALASGEVVHHEAVETAQAMLDAMEKADPILQAEDVAIAALKFNVLYCKVRYSAWMTSGITENKAWLAGGKQ